MRHAPRSRNFLCKKRDISIFLALQHKNCDSSMFFCTSVVKFIVNDIIANLRKSNQLLFWGYGGKEGKGKTRKFKN